MPITRRDLLQAAGVIALSRKSWTASSSPSWCDKPMRWAQVAFTEDDPGNYDRGMWLDYFRRIHADAACLSAGGVVAFYPTKIQHHYRSRFLGDRDTFGELTKGCRDLGMNVVARVDPHACTADAFEAHPEWVARLKDGSPRRHWADASRYVTCALGPYNFDFMNEVIREIVTLYRVDGVFANRWAGHGQCWCDSCRTQFRAFAGMDLPASEDPREKARREYLVWEEHRLFELWRRWDQTIRQVNADACFIANSGGGALSELDMATVGEMAPILFADRQARRGLAAPWANGKNAKEYRAAMGNKPIGGIFSVGVEEPYRWKDSVQAPAEIKAWAIDGIAQGLRPWFTKFNAKPVDTRWMPVVEEIYNWHWKYERYLRNEENLARAAVVFSQQTAKFYGGRAARPLVEDPILGVYQTLIESRVPFEMVHDRKLSEEQLGRLRLLILPNIAALSDAQCRQLEAFVSRGGSLVATGETSLYNEWGARRDDFGLAKLFGCHFAGAVDERLQNSYLNLEHSTKHPLLKRLEGVTRVINGVRWVHTRPAPGKESQPLTLVPSYPDLPMEMVYTETPRTTQPAVYCTEHGKGRVVYFPMDIDRTFWEVLSADHLALLHSAFEWACPTLSPVRIRGKGLMDVAVWRQHQSSTVHLVNLTNPMAMKGPFRETFPIGPIEVDLDIPSDARVKATKLLVSGHAPKTKRQGGGLIVEVPRIDLHEVVAIEWGS